MSPKPILRNYLTIDVEDYYQVSAFESLVGFTGWQDYQPRVEKNMAKILNILDEHDVKATFFILGWTAEKFPSIVKDIDSKGHEVACHSYAHRLIYCLTPEEFKADTQRAKDILEQILGKKIRGYRAPSYSITKKSLWALDILEDLGFEYDSSIFPIYHDRYGMPDFPRFRHKLPGKNLIEYPISTCEILGRKIPVSGGGYFRLFPYWFTQKSLRKINQSENRPFVFYIHPWELDPGQPRFTKANYISKFRHYINLEKTENRFLKLLKDFSFEPIHQAATG